MLTISLPPETELRLKSEASRQGLEAADNAGKLIEAALPKPVVDQVTSPNQASIDVLTKWELENATDDPEEIARRQIEFEEFKAGMNRNRLESGGPNARLVYPD